MRYARNLFAAGVSFYILGIFWFLFGIGLFATIYFIAAGLCMIVSAYLGSKETKR